MGCDDKMEPVDEIHPDSLRVIAKAWRTAAHELRDKNERMRAELGASRLAQIALKVEIEELEDELGAWRNCDPLSPEPERVQMLAAIRERDALKVENERLRKSLDRVRALRDEWRRDGEMGLRDYVATMADMLADALDTLEGENDD